MQDSHRTYITGSVHGMAKEPTQQRKSTEDTSSTLQRNPSASLQPTRRSSNTNTEARHSQRRAFNTSTTSSVQVGVSGSDQNANMRRTSSVSDIPIPITYTPTTHRISKAKKGKRVHACEFPGCNKVCSVGSFSSNRASLTKKFRSSPGQNIEGMFVLRPYVSSCESSL